MTLTLEYFICKESPTLYQVVKMEDGTPSATYKVEKKEKWGCNCMSGHIRGYCKHKDWVTGTTQLPNYVTTQKQVSLSKYKQFLTSLKKVRI